MARVTRQNPVKQLERAIANGDAESVHRLVQLDRDCLKYTGKEGNLTGYAVTHKHAEMLEYLIRHGIKPDKHAVEYLRWGNHAPTLEVLQRYVKGRLPAKLRAAIREKSKEGLRVFLRKEILNTHDNFTGDTPLHLACDAGWKWAVRAMIACGAKPNVNRKGEFPDHQRYV